MTQRNHSTRCRHGFCTVTVGCEACGIKKDAVLSRKLRKSTVRNRNEVPQGYGNTEGRKSGDGNSNARSRH